jgi:hypothetical protein
MPSSLIEASPTHSGFNSISSFLMSSQLKPNQDLPGILVPRPKLNVEAEVSAYDRLNGWLLALIFTFGFIVFAMFLIWVTSGHKGFVPAALTDLPPAVHEDPGEEEDPEDPGLEDFPEVETPQLANALEAIPNAISNVLGRTAETSGSGEAMGRGRGSGTKGSRGVPEYKRWVIQYEADSITTYARQLSFFNIDIGVFYKTVPRIVRLRDPGGATQVIQSSREEERKTLRFMHRDARMKRWDDEMARRANIPLQPDGLTCQFYPEATRQILRRVEAEAYQKAGKTLMDVKNTFFKLEASGSGFTYRVVQVVYR